MNEQLDRIEKMLAALLQNSKHIWWIGGYVYGVTSNNAPFVILYPASDKLNEKVVRVYDHDFRKLPNFIPTTGVEGDTEANPNKEQARRKGIYHECPLFQIVTYDGKETQMGPERRFGDVIRVTQPKGEQPPPPQQQQARVQQQQARVQQQPPPPPDDIDWNAPPPAVQEELPGTPSAELPDYRAMALAAKTAPEFDYMAYMVLKNGLYTEVERIGKTRQMLAPEWKPTPGSNRAMLHALTVYRDKRAAAESRGEAPRAAHDFAKLEAMGAYNREPGMDY